MEQLVAKVEEGFRALGFWFQNFVHHRAADPGGLRVQGMERVSDRMLKIWWQSQSENREMCSRGSIREPVRLKSETRAGFV